MRPQIEIGYSRTLERYADARPDDESATVEGVAGDGTGLFEEEPVALDSVSTTITAAAVKGADELSIDSETGAVAGRKYWITQAGGLGFEIRARAVGTKKLYLQRPLRRSVAIGDTVKGHRLARLVDETSTAQSLATLVWRWKVAGEPRVHRQQFDIVAAPWDPHVTELDLDEGDWAIGEQLGEYGAADILIQEATRLVWRDLTRHGLRDPSVVTARDLVEDAIKAACRRIRYRRHERLGPIYDSDYTLALGAVLAEQQWTGGLS